MKTYQIATSGLLLFALVLGFQNCGSPGMNSVASPAAQNSSQKELQDLRVLINNLNQEDLACAQDADCDAMPVGLRACGGPAEYIAVSKVSENHGQLEGLVELYKQKTQVQLQATNAVGTCLAILPPQVQCVQNVCTKINGVRF